MLIEFGELKFETIGEKIRLVSAFGFSVMDKNLGFFTEVQIAGENHDIHGGAKQFMSSEGEKLDYVSHDIKDNQLTIVQRDDLIEVTSHFIAYQNTNAIRIFNVVKNITQSPLIIESVNSFSLYGLGKNGIDSVDNISLYRFTNSWHVECQPRRASFYDLGLFRGNHRSMKRISGINTGSWSTKEELPQAIIEDTESGNFFMFQIESNGSWYWEIGENVSELYLYLGGPNQHFNQWSKRIEPGEEFETVKVACVSGKNLNSALANMTVYRRHIVRRNPADSNLPTIFNEYMYLSWDNPNEKITREIAPAVAAAGIEYYNIDCGWHNEEDSVYPYVGHWNESKKRFPSGLKKTIDFLHSLGLKAGLWIEPESFGYLCKGMEDIYDDGCFFYRNGKRVLNMGRYQLDFRNPKVTAYLDNVFKRMIEEYGVDYIKIDCNQCAGPGTERNSDSLGDGLLSHNRAYLKWLGKITDKYPDVILETCASGGQRLDYANLSLHSIQSVSDQTDYKKFPYIAGNMLSAVLPEQAGVWSYPVTDVSLIKEDYDKAVTDEFVIFNMINSLLGRLHLASRIDLLSEKHLKIIKDGIRYYNSIAPFKKNSVPYFPLGFTDFRKELIASGFISQDKLFLSVWNLNGTGTKKIPLEDITVSNAKIAFPENSTTPFEFGDHMLNIYFDAPYVARFFELDIKNNKVK